MTRAQASTRDISNNLGLLSHKASLSRNRVETIWHNDPSKHINLDIIRKLCNTEATLYSSSNDRSMRQGMFNILGIPKHPVFNQFVANYNTNQLVTDNRQTRFLEFPVSFALYNITTAVAHNPFTRLAIKARLQGISIIPTGFVHHMRQVRSSQCGTLHLTPELDLTSNIQFIKNYPCFANTNLDLNWLNTPQGIEHIVEFFTRLSQMPETSVKMETYTDTSIPYIDSGTVTTLCSVINEDDNDHLQTVGLISGHCLNLDNPLLGLTIFKAALLSPYLTDKTGNRISHIGNPQFDLSLTSLAITDIIMEMFLITSSILPIINNTPSGSDHPDPKRSRPGRQKLPSGVTLDNERPFRAELE
jgi:hypothetical protein